MYIRLILSILAVVLFSDCLVGTTAYAQEEQEQQGELETVTSTLKEAGKSLSEVGGDAVEAISQGVGDVVTSLSNSLEKDAEYTVTASDKLALKGIKCPLAVRDMQNSNIVKVYATFDRDLSAVLQLRAYNNNAQEIGRSKRLFVKAHADDGIYLNFVFDEQTPLDKADKFTLAEVKGPAQEVDVTAYDDSESNAF